MAKHISYKYTPEFAPKRNLGKRSFWVAALILVLLAVVLISWSTLFAANHPGTSDFLQQRIQRHEAASASQFTRLNGTPKAATSVRSISMIGAASQGVLVSESTAPATFAQDYSDIASFADGSSIVVWQDNRNGDQDIFIRKIAADGSVTDANIDLVSDPDFHDQIQPQVTVNSSNLALVIYNDATTAEIYGIVLDNTLAPVAGPILINEPASEIVVNMPAVAPLSGNRFVVVWEDSRAGASIFAQILGGDGSLHGSNFKINGGGAAAYRISPDVISSLNGDFAVVWEEPTSGSPDVMFRIFTDVGTALFPDLQVASAYSSATQVMPAVSYLGNQQYLVGWISDRGGNQNAWAQRITTSSTEADTSFRLNAADEDLCWDVSFVQTSGGGVAALWADYAGPSAIKLQQLNSAGEFVDTNLSLEDPALLRERSFPHGSAAADEYRFVWTDHRNDNADIYLQRLDDVFLKLGTNSIVNDDAAGSQQLDPDIALISSNGSAVVWCDEQSDGGDIYYRFVSQNGDLIGSALRVNDDIGKAVQSSPRVAGNRSGKGVAVWADSRTVSGHSSQQIMGQVLTTTPGLSGSNFLISNDATGLPKSDPDIAMAPDGAYAVVWTDRRDGSQQIYMQGYNAGGAAVGSNSKISGIVSTSANFQPSVSIDDDHSGVIAWLAVDGDEQVIYYEFFDSSFDLDGANQLLPVSSDGVITAVRVYHHSASGINFFAYLRDLGESAQVELLAVDATKANVWGPIVINEETATTISSLKIGGSSTAVGVTWSDFRTGSERVWMQLVNLDGTLIMSNLPLSGLTQSAREKQPAIILAESYYYTTWVDNRTPSEGYDVFFTNDQFTATDVDDNVVVLPDQFELNQNYPNPFNPETVISFALGTPQHVRLTIYNTLGQRVRTLVNDHQPAGFHRVRWDSRDDSGRAVASGVYLYRLETADAILTRKMTLIK